VWEEGGVRDRNKFLQRFATATPRARKKQPPKSGKTEDQKINEAWERLKAQGLIGYFDEPRQYKSSLASLDDAFRGRNRHTTMNAGEDGIGGGKTSYQPGLRRVA